MKSLFLLFCSIFFVTAPPLSGQNYPEARQSAVMLSLDGDIYLYGGETDGSENQKALYCNDLHKFDSGLNQWTSLPSANWARAGHGGAKKGKMLVFFGGEDETACKNDAFTYNTETNSWEIFTLQGQVFSPRRDFSITQSGDYAYIAGGTNGIQLFRDAFKVNLETGECTALPAPADFIGPIGKAAATVNNQIIFAGGWEETYACLNIYRFNTETNTWSYGYGAPVAGFMGVAAYEGSTKLYYFGGSGTSKEVYYSSVYQLETQTDELIQLSNQLSPANYFNMVCSVLPEENKNQDTLIYLWGGASQNGFYRYDLGQQILEQYDAETGNWLLTNQNEIVSNKTVIVYPNPGNGRIYIEHSENIPLTLSLINSNGAIACQMPLKDKKSIIDLPADVSNGLYYLEFKHSGKLIKRMKYVLIR